MSRHRRVPAGLAAVAVTAAVMASFASAAEARPQPVKQVSASEAQQAAQQATRPDRSQQPSVTDFTGRTPDTKLVAKAKKQAVAQDGEARVVVTLKTAVAPIPTLSAEKARAQKQKVTALQDVAIASIKHGKVIHRFDTTPLVVATATPQDIDALAANPAVADVRLDRLVAPDLASTTPLIGSSRLNTRGVTGTGQTIAVIDTGVDRTHPFLVGRVVDEACFGGCASGAASATGPGTGVNCSLVVAGCGHGTHVAGIAAGAQGANNFGFNGVAPGARLMSINVFHRVDNFWPFNFCGSDPSPCARAWASDEVAGLNHVFNRRFAFSVASINVSIGDGGDNTSTCDGSSFKPIIDNLNAAGIATVVAAGNEGHLNGLSEPACVGSAVSVGATSNGDVVQSWSNSSSYLDLLAPGLGVTSSFPGGGFANMSGTSMAAPHVAGAFALMKQKFPTASVDSILARLRQTGRSVTDAKNGRVTPRLNVEAAAQFPAFNSDFTRDLKADTAVWRPSTGQWFVPGLPTVTWGGAGDKPVAGDYNGDGAPDRAVWRPSNGYWYIHGVATIQWGQAGDVPVPGDYNNDGSTDVAVWRPSTGVWYVRGVVTQQWGAPADIPVPADYNGDGRMDIAVWRPSTGEWFVRGQFTVVWGGITEPADVPVPADYNGDNRADVAIWRPATGVWWVRGQFTQQWGAPGDIPTPRISLGPGSNPLLVWRPGNGTWFNLFRVPIIGNITWTSQWGTAGDWPVGATAKQLR